MGAESLELAFNLAVAQFRLRIAGRYLGIFWYLLEPLSLFLIFLLLRPSLTTTPIADYPEYLLLGLIMMNFFSAATVGAMRSLRDNRNLIKSVSINLEVLPLATVIQFCFSHFFELILFIVIAAYYHSLSWRFLLYPPLFIIYGAFVLGVSLMLTAAGVFIEDLDNIWAVISRLLWLGTPIFYALVPGTVIYRLDMFNPISQYLTLTRNIVVYALYPSPAFVTAAIAGSAAFLAGGLALFRSQKSKFAEFL